MKKVITLILMLTLLTGLLSACGSSYAKGEWEISALVEVTLNEELDEDTKEMWYEEYGVSTDEELCEAAMNDFIEEGAFEPCYLRFEGDMVYVYDPIMEREATYVYYETGENEGFFSVLTDLDPSLGNPGKEWNPEYTYNKDTGKISVTSDYIAFYVTIEYTAK